MDYLYINAIVKETYTDLPCVCPFPETYRGEIRSLRVINDDCMKNPAIPNVRSFYSVKLRDQAPMLVLTNIERHKKSVSVGRFAQHLGWEWNGDLLKNGLDAILDAAFYTEDEILEMAEAGTQAQLPRNKSVSSQAMPLELSSQIKNTILTAVMLRWLRNEPALRIAVPANVDYNQYVISAVKAIYQFFPVGLRAEMGFCSFLPNVQDTMNRVYIGFIPEEMADPATLFLDGSSQAAINKFAKGTGREALDRLTQFLSTRDSSSLASFLEGIYQEVEGNGDGIAISGLSAKNYLPTGDAIRIMMLDGDTKSQLKSWLDFFANIDKYSPSMRHNIKAHIAGKVQPDELCEIFKKECESARGAKDVTEKLRAYQMFGESNIELGDRLWQIAIDVLTSHSISYAKIEQEFFRQKDKLSYIATGERMDAMLVRSVEETLRAMDAQELKSDAQAKDYANEAAQLKKEIEARQTASMEMLLSAVDAFIQKLSGKYSAMTLGNFQSRLETLLNTPTKRYSDMEEAIRKAENLLRELSVQPASAEIADLQRRTQEYLEQKKLEASTSQSKLGKVFEMIENTSSYFAILENLAKEDLSKLDLQEKKQLDTRLMNRCPATLSAFEREFSDYYRSPLTLEAISGMKPYVCQTIVQNICRMDLALVYKKGTKIEDFNKELHNMLYLAHRIRNNAPVGVELNGVVYAPNQFRYLLDSKKIEKVELKPAELENAVVYLAECEVYKTKKDALLKLLKLLRSNRCDPSVLAKCIFKGLFAASKKDYQTAFNGIIESARDFGGSRREMIDHLAKTYQGMNSCSKPAVEAFKAASKKFMGKSKDDDGVQGTRRKSSKQNNTINLILIGAIALVLVAAIVLVVLLVLKPFNKDSGEATEPSESIAEVTDANATEPEVTEDPAVKELKDKLYAQSYDQHLAAVEGFLKAEGMDTSAIATHYRAGSTDLFKGLKYNVTWNEYVFWELWLLAGDKTESVTAETFSEDLHKRVGDILAVLCKEGAPTAMEAVTSEEAALTADEIDTIKNSAKAAFDAGKPQK